MDEPVDAPAAAGRDGATRPAASTFSFVVPISSSSAAHAHAHTHVKPESSASSLTSSAAAAAAAGAMTDESAASLSGRKRKAASSASLRGVANLTPDQLARKRANDRQAQRAIRERTKLQIEALESRVRELSSQQPYQDLQKLVAEKDRILAENDDIRRRLSTVLNILQPLVDRPGSKPPSSSTPSAQPEATHPSPFTDRSHDTPVSVESTVLDAQEPAFDSVSPTSQGVVRGWHRTDAASLVSPITPQPRFPCNGFGEKLIMNFLVDNPHQIPKIDDIHKISEAPHTSETPLPMDYSSMADQPLAHTIPVRNVPATCPLDTIFLDFLRRDRSDGSRQRLAYPSVPSLLNPVEGSPYSYSISKVFSDILRTFPDISSLPEQVGTLYIMFQLMRWQMYPTQQNYDRMPDWMTPRPAQLFTPHPAWMDYIMWPRARDKMVYSYRNYPFENWFVPYTRTISCNWPYETTECLLHNTATDELLINPVFERHVRDLRNWTLGTEFADAFPSLVDVVTIKPDKRTL